MDVEEGRGGESDGVVVVKTGGGCATAALARLPWYTSAMFAAYVAMYYVAGLSEPCYGALALDMRRERRAWTWHTYSLLHGSATHLWVNMMGWCVYGALAEYENGAWRTGLIACASVVGGAFAAGWQLRLSRGTPFVLIGASGGVYGLLSCQIGNLILNFAEMGAAFRATAIASVAMTVAIDVGLCVASAYGATNADAGTSYSAHVGGFATGILAGLTFAINLKALRWERPLRIAAAALLACYAVVGTANMLA